MHHQPARNHRCPDTDQQCGNSAFHQTPERNQIETGVGAERFPMLTRCRRMPCGFRSFSLSSPFACDGSMSSTCCQASYAALPVLPRPRRFRSNVRQAPKCRGSSFKSLLKVEPPRRPLSPVLLTSDGALMPGFRQCRSRDDRVAEVRHRLIRSRAGVGFRRPRLMSKVTAGVPALQPRPVPLLFHSRRRPAHPARCGSARILVQRPPRLSDPPDCANRHRWHRDRQPEFRPSHVTALTEHGPPAIQSSRATVCTTGSPSPASCVMQPILPAATRSGFVSLRCCRSLRARSRDAISGCSKL